MYVRAWVPWVFAVVVSIIFLVALPVQAKGQASTMRLAPAKEPGNMYSNSKLPACQRSFDPYKVPRSFLKKCGVKTIPLAAVKPLPGGGKAYIYYDHGQKTIFPVPPKGFNSCTATDKQLAEYGIPPREHTTGNVKCRPAIVKPQGPFIVETNMTSGEASSAGVGGGLMTSSTGATGASTLPVGSTSSTMSHTVDIPNTGGPDLLSYAAALFMAAGIVTLLVLRQRVR